SINGDPNGFVASPEPDGIRAVAVVADHVTNFGRTAGHERAHCREEITIGERTLIDVGELGAVHAPQLTVDALIAHGVPGEVRVVEVAVCGQSLSWKIRHAKDSGKGGLGLRERLRAVEYAGHPRHQPSVVDADGELGIALGRKSRDRGGIETDVAEVLGRVESNG